MSHKVIVYGTLKKGFGNHRLLETSKFLGTTSVPGTMYSLGGFPGVRLDRLGQTSIKCEVYEVDGATLVNLDRLEGYRGPGLNNFYDRRNIAFSLDGDTQVQTADIYELAEDPGHYYPEVASGVWT